MFRGEMSGWVRCVRQARVLASLRNANLCSSSHGKPENKDFEIIQLDRSNLYTPKPVLKPRYPRLPLTPLGEVLHSQISTHGPMPMAEWMQHCNTHPVHGYYNKSADEIFGKGGDFITSPEISQVYGELIGIWCVANHQQLGSPSVLRLVEIGPGRGTLTADILRISRRFQSFQKAVDVHLVEVSPALAQHQANTLGVTGSFEFEKKLVTKDNVSVTWHRDLANACGAGGPGGAEMTSSPPSLIVAHELLDALPVHQFERIETGWAERYVDINTDDGPAHFRQVLVKRNFLAHILENRGVLPHVASVGHVYEYSPDSERLVLDIANYVDTVRGAALLIDYSLGAQTDAQERTPLSRGTVRGIRNHKFVDLVEEPGLVDLSADVDFHWIARLVREQTKARVTGPINQSSFLLNMGIQTRIQKLLESTTSEEQADKLIDGYNRLTSHEEMGMGKIYQVQTLHSNNLEAIGF